MGIAPSLFDAPTQHPIAASIDWINGALFGTLATSLCVMAIAILGMMLMAGRLSLRDALRMLIGCFVLLGAPTIALGLRGAVDGVSPPAASEAMSDPGAISQPAPLPPANYDPYAGASLRIQ
jgi:type IV secretory pathway VirB2 component (pilin)